MVPLAHSLIQPQFMIMLSCWHNTVGKCTKYHYFGQRRHTHYIALPATSDATINHAAATTNSMIRI